VELAVSCPTSNVAYERISIPRELLRRRSRKFCNLLDDSVETGEPSVIQISDASVETVEDFLVWTISLKPRIEEQTSLHRVVRLGIFAWRYQIHALCNQVADAIQSTLGRGEWQLDAEVVDKVYETLPAESGIRKVFRERLQKLSPVAVRRDNVTQERWEATFLKHAQVGWDCFNRKETEWDMWMSSPSPCRFHEHSQHWGNGGPPKTIGSGCPYAGWECFPSGEGLIQTKVVENEEPEEKADERPVKTSGKAKKGKKKKKIQSHPEGLRVEETPEAEAVTSPKLESTKVLCEEAAPYDEAVPCEEALCEEATPYDEAIPCEEAPCEEAPCEEAPCEEAPCEEALCEEALCEEEAPCEEALCEEALYEEAPCEEVPCEEALCEEVPCEEALCEEALYEEAPCEEAPCKEVTPYDEEAPCEQVRPANEALVEEPTSAAKESVSEDGCSDGWVQSEDDFYVRKQ
jgi:hypothetical protein